MKSNEKQNFLPLGISFLLLIVLFILDLKYPLGIAAGVPYIIVMVVSLWFLKPNQVLLFSIGCSVLALFGFFFKENTSELEGLTNRLMAVFSNVAIALMIRRQTDLESVFDKKEEHLNSLVEKRTEGLKQVVDQLDEAKLRLSDAEEKGAFGFWEYRPSTQHLTWSNGIYKIMGFPVTPQAPSMQDFFDRCHTDDLKNLQQSIQYGLAEQKPFSVDFRIVMPDGELRWIHTEARSQVDSRGRIDSLVGLMQDVTGQKGVQVQMHESQAYFNSIFKSAAVGKVLMIPNKKVLRANASFCRWIGYHERELMKMPLEKLIHEEDRVMDGAYARELMNGEKDLHQQEKRFVHKNGQIKWALFSVATVNDHAQKVTSFIAEIQDITALKEAEASFKSAQAQLQVLQDRFEEMAEEGEDSIVVLPVDIEQKEKEYEAKDQALYTREQELIRAQNALHERQEFFRQQLEVLQKREEEIRSDEEELAAQVEDGEEEAAALAEEVVDHLFHLSNDMMCVLGMDKEYKRVSPAFERILGLPNEKLVDRHFLDFVHPTDVLAMQEHFESLTRGIPMANVICRHKDVKGQYVLLEWSARTDLSKEVIFAIARETGSAPEPAPVSKQFQSIQLVADKLPFLIWILGPDQECVFVNERVCAFTGFVFDQLAGYGWRKGIHSVDLATYKKTYSEKFNEHKPFALTYRYKGSGQGYRWLQECAIPQFDEDEGFKGYLVMGIDITALKEVKDEFERALQNAADLSDISTALLVSKTKEISDIIADSVQVADALVEKSSSVSRPRIALMMRHAGESLLATITSMIDFSVMKARSGTIRMQRVMPLQVLHATLDVVRPLARQYDVGINVEGVKGEPYIEADRMLLYRAFDCLLRLMIKHGKGPVLHLAAKYSENELRILIEADGLRLDTDFSASILSNYRAGIPVTTLVKEDGLDLALASRIIGLLGGRVEIEPAGADKSGCAFIVIFRLLGGLPISPLEPDDEQILVHDLLDDRYAEVSPVVEVSNPLEGEMTMLSNHIVRGLESRSEGGQKGEDSTIKNLTGRLMDDSSIVGLSGDGEVGSPRAPGRPQILVAEQSQENQRLVRSLLQSSYDVTFVSDRYTLQDEVRETQYDLFLLDIELDEGGTGIEFFRIFRQEPLQSGAAVIAVTGSSLSKKEVQSYEDRGYDGVLRKPYSIVELIETVERILGKRDEVQD